MPPLTIGEMCRLGGYGTTLSLVLGIILFVLTIVGFVLARTSGRGRPCAGPLKGWAWIMLVLGFLCLLNAGLGTVGGMTKIYAHAAAAGAEAEDVFAVGTYEVLYNVVFGFFFAGWALFAVLAARLAAGKSKY